MHWPNARISTDVVTEPDSSPRSRTNDTPAVMLGLSTAVLVVGALSVAQSVFAPLAYALFVIAIAWPLQKWLQAGMRRLLALALTVAATTPRRDRFTLLVAWGLGRVGHFIISGAAHLRTLYGTFALLLERHGIAVAGLWADYVNVSRLIGRTGPGDLTSCGIVGHTQCCDRRSEPRSWPLP